MVRNCTKPGCSGQIKGKNQYERKLSCPICNTKVCFQCRQDWHGYYTSCEVALRKKIGPEYGHVLWCPSCKTKIVKEEGCNHMTCNQCAYEYCYICGKPCTSNRPCYCLSPQYGRKKKKCQKCTRQPLCRCLIYVLLVPLILLAIPLFYILFVPLTLARYAKRRFEQSESADVRILQDLAAVFCFVIGLPLDVIAIPILLLLSPYILYLLIQELRDYSYNQTFKGKLAKSLTATGNYYDRFTDYDDDRSGSFPDIRRANYPILHEYDDDGERLPSDFYDENGRIHEMYESY